MSDTLRISELAARSGFSASALRYYEKVGLLNAVDRSPSGYRLYDDQDVSRLRFIERAKQLGLPLDEIRDLVAVWEDGLCAHVRDGLRVQVLTKSTEVDDRIAELTAFRAQLSEALVELAAPATEGSCHAGCGCADPRDDAASGPGLIPLGRTQRSSVPVAPRSEVADAAPIACTLDVADQQDREDEWRAVLEVVARREDIVNGLALHFRPAPGLAARLADLAEREQACCSFFGFAVRPGSDTVVLEVVAPEAATGLVQKLFGAGS